MASPQQVLEASPRIHEALLGLKKALVCAACELALRDPMRMGVCGHTVCGDCAGSAKGLCPFCNVPVMNRDVVSDRGVRNLVDFAETLLEKVKIDGSAGDLEGFTPKSSRTESSYDSMAQAMVVNRFSGGNEKLENVVGTPTKSRHLRGDSGKSGDKDVVSMHEKCLKDLLQSDTDTTSRGSILSKKLSPVRTSNLVTIPATDQNNNLPNGDPSGQQQILTPNKNVAPEDDPKQAPVPESDSESAREPPPKLGTKTVYQPNNRQKTNGFQIPETPQWESSDDEELCLSPVRFTLPSTKGLQNCEGNKGETPCPGSQSVRQTQLSRKNQQTTKPGGSLERAGLAADFVKQSNAQSSSTEKEDGARNIPSQSELEPLKEDQLPNHGSEVFAVPRPVHPVDDACAKENLEEFDSPASVSDIGSLHSPPPAFESAEEKERHKQQLLKELGEAEEILCTKDRKLARVSYMEDIESDCDSDVPMVVISCSAVGKDVQEKCQVVVRLFGGRVVDRIEEETPYTHLVTEVDCIGEVKQFSLKVFHAMAKRAIILSPKWLDACLEEGMWVDETNYEVNSQHSRERGVFASVVASIVGEFVSPPNMNVQDVRSLLKAGGAVLVDHEKLKGVAAEQGKLGITVVDSELEKQRTDRIQDAEKVVGVPWLTDCILTGHCPPTNAEMFETLIESTETIL